MEKTLDAFMNVLEETSNADFIKTETGKIIVLTKHVNKLIEDKLETGKGSIFAKAWKIKDLKESLTKIDPYKDDIYEGKLDNCGYDLIAERKTIVPFRKLVSYKENNVIIEEKEVKTITVPKSIDKFKTNIISYKIRQINEKEAIRDYGQFEQEAKDDKLFIVEDVIPGKYVENLTNHYIVIPNK